MKHIFTFVIAVFLTPYIYGQNHYFEISGGVNLAKIRSLTDLRFAPAVSLGYEFRFAKILSIKT